MTTAENLEPGNSSSQYMNEIITNIWANGRHNVRCVRIIQETADTRTFCFMADKPVMFFFKPGQFVTLELEIDGQQIMRSYTISSSPSVPYSFSITVKKVPGGIVSNWLHEHFQEGGELAVHGPAGNFNCIDYPSDKALLLSGGVGITPLMSMARWFFDTNSDTDITFVHSSRTPDDVIFRRELEHMSSRVRNFSLHVICERQETGQAWSGYRGYLDTSKLSLIAPDFMEREIFCCGPAAYMKAVKKILQEQGFDMSRYHEESFGATPDDVKQDAIDQAEIALDEPDLAERTDLCEVQFSQSGKSIRVAPEETVHSAAAKLGLYIPKACGVGICGTCRVRKLSGEVQMEHNGGITDEDVADGYILACCSSPRGDVDIEY